MPRRAKVLNAERGIPSDQDEYDNYHMIIWLRTTDIERYGTNPVLSPSQIANKLALRPSWKKAMVLSRRAEPACPPHEGIDIGQSGRWCGVVPYHVACGVAGKGLQRVQLRLRCFMHMLRIQLNSSDSSPLPDQCQRVRPPPSRAIRGDVAA